MKNYWKIWVVVSTNNDNMGYSVEAAFRDEEGALAYVINQQQANADFKAGCIGDCAEFYYTVEETVLR